MAKRQVRTVLGSLLAVATGMILVLKLPADVAEIAAVWSGFSLHVPVEAIRLLLVAAVGVTASILIAPGLADGIERARVRRTERREAKRRLEEETRRREALVRGKRRDIGDYLSIILAKPDLRELLEQLLSGPAEFSVGLAEFMERAGVIEGVAVTESVYGDTMAVFRLTDLARPIVEARLAPSKPPQEDPLSSKESG